MPLAVLAPKQLAALAAVAAILCFAFGWRTLRRGPHLPVPVLALLGGLTIWMAASTLWTVDIGFTLLETLRFAAMTVGGLILIATARALDEPDRDVVSAAFLAGYVAGLALLAFEIATEGLLLRSLQWLLGIDKRFIFSITYNRATSVIGILSWPAALFFLRRRAPILATLAVVAGGAMTFELHKWASLIALVSGAAVFAVGWFAPRATARLLAVALAAALFVAPIVPRTVLAPDAVVRAYPDIGFSEYHRVLIWHFAAENIAKRPLLGWGMNSSRVIPGGKEKVQTAIPERGTRGSDDPPAELMPLHPHNTPLQLWLELGVLGVFAAAALAILLSGIAANHAGGRMARAASLATFVAAIVIASMSFSMWQSWWLAVLWLAATLLTVASPATPESRKRS
jgi:exopolysaccharide production protein ExoQ